MAEKYFEAPQSAEDVNKLYEDGKEYNSKIDLNNTVETNRNFYSGKQWEGLDTEGLKPIIINFIKPTVQIKVASIMSDDIALVAQPTGIPGAGAKDQGMLAEIVSNELNRLWEKRKLTAKTRKTLTSACIDGDGCWHLFWDEKAPIATVDPNVFGDAGQNAPDMEAMGSMDITGGLDPMAGNQGASESHEAVAMEGDIGVEQIYNTRVFFGNNADPEVQGQPWVLVATREFTATLKKRAEENGVGRDDIDAIKGAADDYFDDDQDDRTTLLTLYYRDEDTSTIWMLEATGSVLIKEATDTGLHFYPVSWLNWDDNINSYHGTAPLTELVKNQLAVNVLATMAVTSVSRSAFPTIIYREEMIPGGYDNAVGAQIGVNGFVEDMNNIIKVVEGANYGYQVDKLLQYLIDTTTTLNGVTDATLGNVRPENTTALLAAQKAAVTPLELNKQALYQFVEDFARCAIDFMACFYGVRTVLVSGEGGDVALDFDFSQLNTVAFDIKIDAGGTSYWSEIMETQRLDNLLLRGVIDASVYVDAMSANTLPHKHKIVEGIRQKEEEAKQMKLMEMQMKSGGNAPAPRPMAQGRPQEAPASPIAPTAAEMEGMASQRAVNAMASRARL